MDLLTPEDFQKLIYEDSINKGKKEYGDYSVKEIYINGEEYKFSGQPVINRNVITSLDENIKQIIKVVLK